MGEVKTYSEKMKDPRWQKKRLKLLDLNEWACEACQTKEKTLHVHHSYYDKSIEPWDYPDYVYVILCDECHEKMHLLIKAAQLALRRVVSNLSNINVNDLFLAIKALFLDYPEALLFLKCYDYNKRGLELKELKDFSHIQITINKMMDSICNIENKFMMEKKP